MADGKMTQAHIAETGASAFAVTIDVSGHRLVGDEPEGAGGGNLGPAPYDMLLAALGECTAMTVRWVARQKNWPVEKVEVELTHHKEKREGQRFPIDVFTKKVILHAPALTDEQRAKLIDAAGKCPVQRTLEGTPEIRTE